jgi:hypothetical protein
MASFTQSSVRGGSLAAALLALAGCVAAQPTGPQVYAMPGAGKSYEQFMGEDGYCRQAAATLVGPAPDTTNAAVGSAVLGTALGAAAGAAIGSVGGAVGGGAAVGGAMGLLVGSSIGGANAQATSGNLQRSYDIAYSQCMTAKGNSVPTGQQAPPYGYGGYGYGYGGPAVVVGGPMVYGGYGYGYRRYGYYHY